MQMCDAGDDQVMIRNPVTDAPRMAPAPGDADAVAGEHPTVASARAAGADKQADKSTKK